MLSYYLAYAFEGDREKDTLSTSAMRIYIGNNENTPTLAATPTDDQLNGQLDNANNWVQYVYGPFIAQGSDVLHLTGYALQDFWVMDDIAI